MPKIARVLLLIGLPLAAFLGLGFYDASQRAYYLQDMSFEGFANCQRMHPNDEAANRACIAPWTRQLATSRRDAFIGAIPGALIAAGTCLIVLALGLFLIGRRQRSGAD